MTIERAPEQTASTATPAAPERTVGTDRVREPEARPAHVAAGPSAADASASGSTASDPTVSDATVADETLTPREVLTRQRQRFGGVKIGSALFGWLAATGTATILAALVAGIAATLRFSTDDPAVGWLGAAVLVVVPFAAYYSGGYVAGRMARFDGAAQGLAVWVWGLVIAIVAALVSVALDSRYDIFSELGAMPRVPGSESDGELTVFGLVMAALIALSSLGGAVLGGMAGTRFHRRVDRVALRAGA